MTQYAITHAIIFSVDEKNTVLRNGTIIFDQDGIQALGPSDTTPIPGGASIINGNQRIAVLPGLIDCHSHSSLLKGFSENKSLLDWLPDYQREHQVLEEEDAYFACMVSYLEALKGGSTCVVDMYRFMHQGAQAASDLGMRACLVPYMADKGDKTFFETLDANEDLIKRHHNTQNGRIQVMIGLEHLFYCTEKAYRRAADMARSYDVCLHTHSSEFKGEVEEVVKAFGKRPVHLLKERGILGPKTMLAHGVWLDDSELDCLADCGAGIVHCPTSNAKLAGGSARIADIQKRNIPLSLGTDGSISNNSLSMIECMKFASLLQKNTRLDPTALSATEVLRMATIDGARMIHQDHRIGSLEVGKDADIILIDLWQPHLMPITPSQDHDPVLWNIVFSGRAGDVRDVWVQGRHVIANGASTGISERDMLEHVHTQTKDLIKRREGTRAITIV